MRKLLIINMLLLFALTLFSGCQVKRPVQSDFKTNKAFVQYVYKLSNQTIREYQLKTTSQNKTFVANIMINPKKKQLYLNALDGAESLANRFYYDDGTFYIYDAQAENTYLMVDKNSAIAKNLNMDMKSLFNQEENYYQKLFNENVSEQSIAITDVQLDWNNTQTPAKRITFTLPLDPLNVAFTENIQQKTDANLDFYAEVLLNEAIKKDSTHQWTESEKTNFKNNLITEARLNNKQLVTPKITAYTIVLYVSPTTSQLLQTEENFTQYTGKELTDIQTIQTFTHFDDQVIFPNLEQFTINAFE